MVENPMLIFVAIAIQAILGKTLVLLDAHVPQSKYSTLLGRLADDDVDILPTAPPLVKYGGQVYRSVIVLEYSGGFDGALGIGSLVDHVQLGGNVLVVAPPDMSENIRDFAYEFSVDFERSGSLVKGPTLTDPLTIEAKSTHLSGIVPASIKTVPYHGIGHKLSGKNKLIAPVLVACSTCYSYITGRPFGTNSLVGRSLVLVSAFQALNNARIVFSGSTHMLSDAYLFLTSVVCRRQQKVIPLRGKF